VKINLFYSIYLLLYFSCRCLCIRSMS